MSDRAGPTIAIVGAGLMGRWHAHFAAQAGGRIVAIVDRDPRAAQALARKSRGARSGADPGLAFEADIVHVCTPSASHASVAHAALDAGCHLLVEKPLAGSLAEAREILDHAARARRLLAPVHQFRFQQGFARLLEKRQILGDLVRCEIRISSVGGEGRDRVARRGILLEMLPHAVSLLRPLLGSVGEGWRILRLTDDQLDLASERGGALALILFSLTARPTQNVFTVAGTRATARADLFHGFATIDAAAPTRASKALAPFRQGGKLLATASGNLVGRAVKNAPAYPGLGELIASFYRAVDRHAPSPIEDEEMLDAAVLMDEVARG